MLVARTFAGLILVVLNTALCGCVAHHHGISHPRDYGTIGTTPHCVASGLIRDPLFFGHRPTRWRQWPSDYITWRYSTADEHFTNAEEVIIAPGPTVPPDEDAEREELPIAPDPFESNEFEAEETDEPPIDRLPDAPRDSDSAAEDEAPWEDPAAIGESINADANPILDARE